MQNEATEKNNYSFGSLATETLRLSKDLKAMVAPFCTILALLAFLDFVVSSDEPGLGYYLAYAVFALLTFGMQAFLIIAYDSLRTGRHFAEKTAILQVSKRFGAIFGYMVGFGLRAFLWALVIVVPMMIVSFIVHKGPPENWAIYGRTSGFINVFIVSFVSARVFVTLPAITLQGSSAREGFLTSRELTKPYFWMLFSFHLAWLGVMLLLAFGLMQIGQKNYSGTWAVLVALQSVTFSLGYVFVAGLSAVLYGQLIKMKN